MVVRQYSARSPIRSTLTPINTLQQFGRSEEWEAAATTITTVPTASRPDIVVALLEGMDTTKLGGTMRLGSFAATATTEGQATTHDEGSTEMAPTTALTPAQAAAPPPPQACAPPQVHRQLQARDNGDAQRRPSNASTRIKYYQLRLIPSRQC